MTQTFLLKTENIQLERRLLKRIDIIKINKQRKDITPNIVGVYQRIEKKFLVL